MLFVLTTTANPCGRQVGETEMILEWKKSDENAVMSRSKNTE
jgi:hypothetical protein